MLHVLWLVLLLQVRGMSVLCVLNSLERLADACALHIQDCILTCCNIIFVYSAQFAVCVHIAVNSLHPFLGRPAYLWQTCALCTRCDSQSAHSRQFVVCVSTAACSLCTLHNLKCRYPSKRKVQAPIAICHLCTHGNA